MKHSKGSSYGKMKAPKGKAAKGMVAGPSVQLKSIGKGK